MKKRPKKIYMRLNKNSSKSMSHVRAEVLLRAFAAVQKALLQFMATRRKLKGIIISIDSAGGSI